jgi:hypothetical protein
VSTGSIVHPAPMLGRVSQAIEPKRRGALCVATPSVGLGEPWPGNLVQATTAVVCRAFAAGRPLGWLACGRPRGAQRAPRGKTGLIAPEPQGLALLGLA